MKTMIAYCGIDCQKCPAYIATQNNDNNARKKVAAAWQKMFNPHIKPKDINCDGCRSHSSRLFNYCQECKIRRCGIGKKVENCAYCQEYICANLAQFFKIAPTCQTVLDNIKKISSK